MAVPDAPLVDLPAEERRALEGVLASLGTVPDGACVGVGFEELSGVVARSAWWQTLDARGRPVALHRRIVNDDRTFEETSSFSRRGEHERQIHRRLDDQGLLSEHLIRVHLDQGLPVRFVERRDEPWGDNRRVMTIDRDPQGHERERIETFREGPLRERVVTDTKRDGERTVTVTKRDEVLPACVVSMVRTDRNEVWTTRCEGDAEPTTIEHRSFDAAGRLLERVVEQAGTTELLVWVYDEAGRAAALHREAPLVGFADVRWVRDPDGELLGTVEVGQDHRIVRSFTTGCGEEPRPDQGDVR